MRFRRTATVGALAAIAAFAIVAAPSGGVAADATGKKRTAKVKVEDDVFTPATLKVKKDTTIKWKWLPENGNPHNVTLKKSPKLKKKQKKKLTSKCTGAICDTFKTKLVKKGKYRWICTIHPTTMVQNTRVK